MYLSYVFFIIVAVFVSVQSDDSRHIAKRHNDFTVSEVVDCAAHHSRIPDSMKNSACKPYYKHVHLKSMPLQEFRPSVVLVKRCSGNCPGNACMPIKRQMIKIPVKLAHHHPNKHVHDMCALVEVEEHVLCSCMCVKMKEDCNPKTQHYVESSCACTCRDHDMKKDMCEKKAGMVWDGDDCSCNCTEMNVECTSGLMWNKEKCACMKTSGNHDR